VVLLSVAFPSEIGCVTGRESCPKKPVPLIFLPGSFQEQVERENKMRCNDNLPMLIYKTEVVVVIALLSVSSIFSGVLVNFYVTTEEVD